MRKDCQPYSALANKSFGKFGISFHTASPKRLYQLWETKPDFVFDSILDIRFWDKANNEEVNGIYNERDEQDTFYRNETSRQERSQISEPISITRFSPSNKASDDDVDAQIAPFVACNFQRLKYFNPNFNKADVYHTLNIEAGVGRYVAVNESGSDAFSEESWEYHGFGASMEYKIPFMSPAKISTMTGEKFRPLLFNARLEFGYASVVCLVIPTSFQAQIGYTTDFCYHYIRPGIGLHLGTVELGIEWLLALNHPNSYITGIRGFYARYNFFSYD